MISSLYPELLGNITRIPLHYLISREWGETSSSIMCFEASIISFSPNRSPKAALLFQLWPNTADDPHAVHKPLPGPHHHLYHLHQCHHHVLRALQSTTCKMCACVRGDVYLLIVEAISGCCVVLGRVVSTSSCVFVSVDMHRLIKSQRHLAVLHL